MHTSRFERVRTYLVKQARAPPASAATRLVVAHPSSVEPAPVGPSLGADLDARVRAMVRGKRAFHGATASKSLGNLAGIATCTVMA